MALDIYNMVKEVIGSVPIELEFVYGICTILIVCMLIECVFVIPIKMMLGK